MSAPVAVNPRSGRGPARETFVPLAPGSDPDWRAMRLG